MVVPKFTIHHIERDNYHMNLYHNIVADRKIWNQMPNSKCYIKLQWVGFADQVRHWTFGQN